MATFILNIQAATALYTASNEKTQLAEFLFGTISILPVFSF
jgi:hypothetical protein